MIIIVFTAVQEEISAYKITLQVKLNFLQVHNTVRDSIACTLVTQKQYNMEGPSLIQSNSISEWVHYNAQFQHQTVMCLGCMKVSALENVPVNTKKYIGGKMA